MVTPEDPSVEERRERYRTFVVEQIRAWGKKHGDPKCPVDGTWTWAVDVPAEMPLRGEAFSGLAYPVVPLTCNTCGYIMSLAARRVGVPDEADFENQTEDEV